MIQNLIIDKSCRINGGVRTFGYSTSANTAIADNQHIRIFNCGIRRFRPLLDDHSAKPIEMDIHTKRHVEI